MTLNRVQKSACIYNERESHVGTSYTCSDFCIENIGSLLLINVDTLIIIVYNNIKVPFFMTTMILVKFV